MLNKDDIYLAMVSEQNRKLNNLREALQRIPYVITEDDVGRRFGSMSGFGTVLKSDVGKRVFLKDGILYIENEEQRDKRIAKKNTEIPKDKLEGHYDIC